MRIILNLGIATALWLALPGAVLAQGTGSLSGTVVDQDQRPIVGAVLSVVGNGLDLSQRSGMSGRFAFASLPIGTYRLSASASQGEVALAVDLSTDGANVSMVLLKTLARVKVEAVSLVSGSGTDVVLNQTLLVRSPAGGALPNLLLQLPGAARGANGVVHINGDHGDINYVVDGVSIPQALNREVGSEIDPSNVSFMDILEGAYTAQYGGRFAAIVNIDTKAANGPASLSGYVSGGSYAAYDSDIDYQAPMGKGSIVLASRQDMTSHALDPPNFTAVHDAGSNTNQFVRYALSLGNDFVLASISHSYQTFQIPNDVQRGEPANDSDNETQDDSFANLRYHHALRSNGALTYGVAFKRSRIRDLNDPANDFTYGEALNLASGGTPSDCANGVVSACAFSLFSDRTARDVILDADDAVNSLHHAVRYGTSYDATNVQKLYAITLQPQNFISPSAATIVDNAPNVAHTETGYVQDSWSTSPLWNFDYGVRFDAFQVFSSEFARGFSQVSPRLKITRKYGSRANVYIYAGRFFTPFSFENVSPRVAAQLDAPLQPAGTQFDLKPQRDTDFEIGGHLPFGSGELGLRVSQKIAIDLIDDTQVGVTALHQDINYARGNIATQSAYYQQPLLRAGRAYLSLTHTRSVNEGCETQLLAPCFGAPNDWTPADHDQNWDANGGLLLNERSGGGWFAIDGEYGGGLSSAYCAPQTSNCKVPPHTTFDFEKGAAIAPRLIFTVRISNILNDRYRITYLNAQGNHYDAGRTFQVGLRFGDH